MPLTDPRRHRTRPTVAAIAAAVLVAIVVGIVTACSGPLVGPHRSGSPTPAVTGPASATSQGAPATAACSNPAPRTAQQWQARFDDLGDRWQGADVASTTALPDGRTVWLFGDTLQRHRGTLRTIHNSMVISDRGCMHPVLGTEDTEPLPTRGDGQWYWPTHAVVDAGRMFVFAQTVRKAGEGVFGFAGTGMALAEFTVPPGEDPVLKRIHDTPSTNVPETGPQYGAAVFSQGGYTYIYATQKVHRHLVFGRNVYLARVRSGHLPDLTRWRYWNGRAWSTDPDTATVIRAAEEGTPGTFSAHPLPGGGIVTVAKENDFLGDDLVVATATSPAGAWRVVEVGKAPSDPHGRLSYLALGHPDLPLASGRLLVSVSRNHVDPARVEAQPALYRPQFREMDPVLAP